MFRMFGILMTFVVVIVLMKSTLVADKRIKQRVNADPVVQDHQKTLKDIGVNASDQKALEKYTMEQMKQIQEYQNQQTVPHER